MGSGKSTYGRLIANKLGCSFIDTDHYIEKKEGRSISVIFSDDGEEYFRDVETDVLKEVLGNNELKVISLGGGTPLRKENRELMKKGYTIFLKVSAEEAYERLKHDSKRPLLKVADPKGRIAELLEQRDPIYESAADYVLYEEKKSLDDIFLELSKVVKEI